jgi:hypothetical protein
MPGALLESQRADIAALIRAQAERIKTLEADAAVVERAVKQANYWTGQRFTAVEVGDGQIEVRIGIDDERRGPTIPAACRAAMGEEEKA